MASVLVNETSLQDIANAIREKNGTETTYKPSEMGNAIREITGGGSDLVKYVTFMSEDGATELFKMPVLSGDTCKDPVSHGDIEKPTKESTNTENYAYSGWSATSGGNANANILKNVTEDKTVYASYTASVRYYTVRIYDEDTTTLLQTLETTYGADARSSVNVEKAGYKIGGYTVDISNVTSDIDTVIMWTIDDGIIRDDWATIDANASSYKVGDKKEVTLTYSDGTSETMYFTIIDKDVDILQDKTNKARLTFMADNIPSIDFLDTGVTTTSGNVDLYQHKNVKTFFNETFFASLPVDLQSAIKPVWKDYGKYWSCMKTFTVSSNQLDGSAGKKNYNSDPLPQSQYKYFANGNSKARSNLDGTINKYIVDTCVNSNYYFYCVEGSGYALNYGHVRTNLTSNRCVTTVPCFCI